MEVQSSKKRCMSSRVEEKESRGDYDEDEGRLPGFRFHPTDEELVGFYLKKKVEKRQLPVSFQIIKQVDIYKHDPWDLSKYSSSNNAGDKEWYFYCKRGRKYRNSIRPNRVTGSGFWKATGIDRPIYSNGGEGNQCIGLKKSLVYYRGSAGKGTKTDWMMHEFRLPTDHPQQHQQHNLLGNNQKDTSQEAEIWTLCRIFKRHKKHTPDWREISGRRNTMNASSKTSSNDSNANHECYISFATHHSRAMLNDSDNSNIRYTINDHKPALENDTVSVTYNQKSAYFHVDEHYDQQRSSVTHTPPSTASYSSSLNLLADDENDINDLQSFAYYEQINGWDDLNSVVEFAVRTPLL